MKENSIVIVYVRQDWAARANMQALLSEPKTNTVPDVKAFPVRFRGTVNGWVEVQSLEGTADLFKRMQARFHEPVRTPATTPVGEIAQAAGDAIGSYFRTHPQSEDRARRLADLAAKYHNGESYYLGKQNLHQRIRRSGHAYPGEVHGWREFIYASRVC